MGANISTAGEWSQYECHRRCLADLVVSRAVRGGRLCVLGAGNCNDLDLAQIAALFDQVHLVDLDAEALHRALGRNGSIADRLVLHGGVDVTGIASLLAPSGRIGHSPENLSSLVARAKRAPSLPCGTNFDVVLSATVFTQIVDTVVRAIRPDHSSTLDLVLAARTGHLRLMFDLLAPAGTGLFVTDLVSSDTYPDLLETPDEELAKTMQALIASRNFFTGTNPAAIVESIWCDPQLAPRFRSVSLSSPWRWQVDRDRQRLVYALLLQRR